MTKRRRPEDKERSRDLVRQCAERKTICCCRIRSNPRHRDRADLAQTKTNCDMLERILLEDKCSPNENRYLTWTCDELRTALIQRGMDLPKNLEQSAMCEALQNEDKSPRHPFRFMDLPLDVRVMIYERVFCGEPESKPFAASEPNCSLRHALLAVSQSVQNEAAYIFCRNNRFQFIFKTDPEDRGSAKILHPRNGDPQLTSTISPALMTHIRYVAFQVDSAHIDMDLSDSDSTKWTWGRPYDGKTWHDRRRCPYSEQETLAQTLTRAQEAVRQAEINNNAGIYKKTLALGNVEEGLRLAAYWSQAFVRICGKGSELRLNRTGLQHLSLAAERVLSKIRG